MSILLEKFSNKEKSDLRALSVAVKSETILSHPLILARRCLLNQDPAYLGFQHPSGHPLTPLFIYGGVI